MTRRKSSKNLISLILGIIFILSGLTWISLILPTGGDWIVPLVLLILGAVLALMGGLRKW